MSTYKDDLGALVQSAGFTAMKQYAKQHWGPVAYAAKVKQALARSQSEPGFNLAQNLLTLDAVNTEVNALMSWPDEELQKLAHQAERDAQPTSMMRGGR